MCQYDCLDDFDGFVILDVKVFAKISKASSSYLFEKCFWANFWVNVIIDAATAVYLRRVLVLL